MLLFDFHALLNVPGSKDHTGLLTDMKHNEANELLHRAKSNLDIAQGVIRITKR
jgi:hypothetical protein